MVEIGCGGAPGERSTSVATYLGRAGRAGAFAIFELPDRASFAQLKRVDGGGVRIELSRRSPELEALLGTLGAVTILEGYHFPVVTSRPGDDPRVADVISTALAVMAASGGLANLTRVRTGSG